MSLSLISFWWEVKEKLVDRMGLTINMERRSKENAGLLTWLKQLNDIFVLPRDNALGKDRANDRGHGLVELMQVFCRVHVMGQRLGVVPEEVARGTGVELGFLLEEKVVAEETFDDPCPRDRRHVLDLLDSFWSSGFVEVLLEYQTGARGTIQQGTKGELLGWILDKATGFRLLRDGLRLHVGLILVCQILSLLGSKICQFGLLLLDPLSGFQAVIELSADPLGKS